MMKNKTATITRRTTCRVCGSKKLTPILSLGQQYAVGFLADPKEKTVKGPLDLVLCNIKDGGCGLLQLRHTLDHDILYRQYWYKSGISTTMVAALGDIVASAEKMVPLQPGNIVVDIGANDGTLLRQYKTKGIAKIGFEPSNLWKLGVSEHTHIIHDYFNQKSFTRQCGQAKARIITSIAMFYDLENPNQFVADIKACLDDDGLWVIQMNYLGLMIDNLTFDNISHEHLEYYSFLSLENLLKRHGLEIIDVELNDVNGGSYRVYIRKPGARVKPCRGAARRVEALRRQELRQGYDKKAVYAKFSKDIAIVKDKLMRFLKQEVRKGKTIYIYGASTRGLVVLQYAGIDRRLIKAAVDKNADKWGRFIVGTGVQVIPFDDYRANLPDYLLVLPYQFKDEIARQEKDFLLAGGKMIFALPEFQVITKDYFKK